MLSYVSSAHLTEAVFKVNFTAGPFWHPNFHSVGWSEVDEALHQSAFSNLEKVEIYCIDTQYWPGEPEWEDRPILPERIMNLMPKCDARGILGWQADQASLANLLSLAVE
jgi:hypothetical protein